MHITLRQLRLFLALADSGSVSAAARLLHITQPTASMQLREISQSVGLPLYDVIGKKVYLTDAGKALATTARSMQQAWEAFEQDIDARKGLARGKLRVAVVSTAKYFMPRLLGAFCRQYPDIDVALEILNRDGVVQRLRDNLDDLYIMSMPPADLALCDEVFLHNPIVMLAAADHPLAGQASLPLAALQGERFILRETGSGTRMAVDRHFATQGFRPDIRLELGSNEAIKEAVAGGLGLGITSRHALRGEQSHAGVCELAIAGFPLPSQWHIVHPAGKQLSPLASVFRQHLLQTFAAAPAAKLDDHC